MCVFAAKREERERRRGGVTVPPPRPAFPKAAATTGSGGRVKRVGKEGGLGDRKVGGGMSEEELWAKLECQEREEEEEEERKDGVAVPGMGGGGGVRKTTSVITFTHTETVTCSKKPPAPDQVYDCVLNSTCKNQDCVTISALKYAFCLVETLSSGA